MGKYEKLLKKWIENPPKEASKEDVLNLALHYGIKIRQGKKASHYVVEDVLLNEFRFKGNYPDILSGVMTIPVKGGKKVAGIYIKRLVEFIQFKKEMHDE